MVSRKKPINSNKAGSGEANATFMLMTGCGVCISCTKKPARNTAPDNNKPHSNPEFVQSRRLP